MSKVAELLINEVRALAEEYPDAVYQGPTSNGVTRCSYKAGHIIHGPPDECGCVFGVAGRRIGLDLGMFEAEGVPLAISDVYQVYMDMEQSRWCQIVQDHQDMKNTWGEAVIFADEELIEGES